jgi:hypothetical protein
MTMHGQQSRMCVCEEQPVCPSKGHFLTSGEGTSIRNIADESPAERTGQAPPCRARVFLGASIVGAELTRPPLPPQLSTNRVSAAVPSPSPHPPIPSATSIHNTRQEPSPGANQSASTPQHHFNSPSSALLDNLEPRPVMATGWQERGRRV